MSSPVAAPEQQERSPDNLRSLEEFNQLGESPAQSSAPEPEGRALDFPDALRAVIDGKRITRVDWNDGRIYFVIKDELLMIHKANGNFHPLNVSEADLVATDWIVI